MRTSGQVVTGYVGVFSRQPDGLSYSGEGTLTPLSMEEEVSSLSAIILDDNYYQFLLKDRALLKDIPVLGTEYVH